MKIQFAIVMHGEVCGPFDSIGAAAEFAEELGLLRFDLRMMTSPEEERKARAEFVPSRRSLNGTTGRRQDR